MNLVSSSKRIRDTLFFLIVFCIIFDYGPKAIWNNLWGLGGPYSNMLGDYPIMAGFLFTAFMIYKGYIHLWNRYAAFFFCITFLIYEASAIHGLYIYPYWDLVLNAPEPQIEKLPWGLNLLHKHQISISYEQLFSIWIFVRSIKSAFFELLYQFGVSYMIYLWYKNDFRRAWSVFFKGLLAGLAVFIAYGLVDVFYQHGSLTAAFILKQANPLIHDIGKVHDWWPPLLWENQFRSVFSEPSRVGNYIAFALPFLFIPILNKSKQWKYYIFLVFSVSYMVFLTRARTAVSMLLGILALSVILLLFLFGKGYIKRFIMILCVVVGAFVISIASTSLFSNVNFNGAEPTIHQVAVEYMEDNVGSLASSNKRSNQARYALLKSNVKIGLEHPVLGVGEMLNGAYVVEHFDDFDLQSNEVQQWIDAYWGMGPLKHNFDAMNKYATVFATKGILGLLCLLFPFIYGCTVLLCRIRKCSDTVIQVRLFSLILATISSLVAGCNGSLILIYAVWILLSLVYIALSDKELGNEKSF